MGVSVEERNSLFKRTDREVLQLPISNSFYLCLKELLSESRVSTKGTSQCPSDAGAQRSYLFQFISVKSWGNCSGLSSSSPHPRTSSLARTMSISLKIGFQASLVAQMVKNLPAMQETQVQSLGQEDPLEEGMATRSSIFAWRIPRTQEEATVHEVAHNLVTNVHTQ